MPKSTKKRTAAKNLPRPKQELTAKSAKKVKGGIDAQSTDSTLGTITQKVKTGGTITKGSWTLGGVSGGLQ